MTKKQTANQYYSLMSGGRILLVLILTAITVGFPLNETSLRNKEMSLALLTIFAAIILALHALGANIRYYNYKLKEPANIRLAGRHMASRNLQNFTMAFIWISLSLAIISSALGLSNDMDVYSVLFSAIFFSMAYVFLNYFFRKQSWSKLLFMFPVFMLYLPFQMFAATGQFFQNQALWASRMSRANLQNFDNFLQALFLMTGGALIAFESLLMIVSLFVWWRRYLRAAQASNEQPEQP